MRSAIPWLGLVLVVWASACQATEDENGAESSFEPPGEETGGDTSSDTGSLGGPDEETTESTGETETDGGDGDSDSTRGDSGSEESTGESETTGDTDDGDLDDTGAQYEGHYGHPVSCLPEEAPTYITSTDPLGGVCMPPCEGDADCPSPPPSGEAEPSCDFISDFDGFSYCVLGCGQADVGTQGSCPDEMTCSWWQGGSQAICLFAV